MPRKVDLPDLDVAIVGGGVSGIYTAWRLLTADLGTTQLADWARQRQSGTLTVNVFEGSDRVGGRLLSARSPNMPDVTCELGGMRYVYPAQKLVTGLVEKELKLPWHEQMVYVPGNIAFLRGRLLRCSDLANPAMLPFNFDQAEASSIAAHGAAPDALILRALLRDLPDLLKQQGNGKLRQYLQDAEIDGTPLHLFGFWNLLARHLSADAYMAARATIGYDCLGGNYNAVDMIAEIFEFTPDVTYRMVNEGYETVPWTLQQRFESVGGQVQTERWLKGFDKVTLADGSIGVSLRFFADRPSVTARAIVLAMPPRSIELLLPECPVLNAHVRGLLNAVAAIPLHKLFLIYETPWWQDAGVRIGRSLTDLPLRQCYYWAAGKKRPGESVSDGPAAIMAYNDMLNVSFWSGLRPQPLDPMGAIPALAGWQDRLHPLAVQRRSASSKLASQPLYFEPRGDHYFAARLSDTAFGPRLQRNWDGHKATQQMTKEMHRQLLLMHGIDNAPKQEPIDAAFMDWSDDPYGGGVHLWNVGYKSWEVLEDMTQPAPDFPCYVCGEAYSTNQTWVEGALQTAEIVLRKRLGLDVARWHDA